MLKKYLLILIVPVLFLIYALLTLDDYGINWDEPYHFRRGQAFLQYILTGKKDYSNIPRYPPLKGNSDAPNFRDSEKHFQEVVTDPSLSDPDFRRSYYQDEDWNGEYHIDIEDPYGHPSLNGILASAFNRLFYQKLGIFGDLESYHLFEITIAFFLVLAVAFFMAEEFGIIESIVSALALSTYPLFLGESHFNIKDPVEAAFYTFTLISFYKAVTRKSPLWLLLTALSFGVALSVKFNVVFISIPCLIWVGYYIFKNIGKIKFDKKFFTVALFSPVIITLILITSYPTLWNDPVSGIGMVLTYYLGTGYTLSQPAGYYLWGIINTYPSVWIFYTTPIVTLVLFATFFLFAKEIFKKNMLPLLLLLSFLTILGRISFFGAASYGGVRLIMEFIPIMAMMAGMAAGTIAKKFKGVSKTILVAIILLAFLPIIIKLIGIHPNESVFFNIFAGGLSGAKQKNINSWGNSYGNAYYPALLWLNQNAEINAKLTVPIGSISNIPRFKLRKDISLSLNYWSGPRNEGEYVIELTYDYEPMKWYSLSYLNTAMKPVYEVKVDGVAIAKLWKNSPEFVIPEYKNTETIRGKITNSNDQYVEIVLPETEKIMQIDLNLPIQSCQTITTGYVETSKDREIWIRQTEDIARDQLAHAKLRQKENVFTFYFVGVEAKYIRFHPENNDACILKADEANIRVLVN